MPFLRNVTRGRGIPAERLAEVAQHYLLFGGKSPINDQCRSLLAALTNELRRRDIQQPLYWGNRNWDPYLGDELRAIERDGHRRILAVVTSAYPSYSSCRQYRENLFDAAQGTQVDIDRIRHYANHPGFVDASVEASLKALDALGERADEARLVFVTHSIPMAMAETAGPAPRISGRGIRRLACGRRVRGNRSGQPAARPKLRERSCLLLTIRSRRSAMAGAGHQRSSARPRRAWRTRRGSGADRLRVRSHGGGFRLGYRGSRDR